MGVTFTNIIILDLLPESELQTGLGLLRHLQDSLPAERQRCIAYEKIRTEADIDTYLFHVRSMARRGCKPIIHIECHGDEQEGLRLKSGYFGWPRLLGHLQKINFLAKNNVVLFLAGCHGTKILSALDITKPSPFFVLISSDEEVKAGFIKDVTGHFYERLFDVSDFKTAAKILAPNFRITHAELFFLQAFAAYLRDHGSSRSRQLRLENILSFVQPSNSNRAVVRNIMREILKDNKRSFERLGKVFLHGRRNLGYEEFLRAHAARAAS
jgi:hypothetical protein